MNAATRHRVHLRGLAWAAAPLAVYLVVLWQLWFDAPVWDDYETILDSVLRLRDAPTAREWLGILVAQHNEHRIAVMRATAWTMAKLSGEVDFRALVLVGNLALFGIFALLIAQFRAAVAPALLAATGFLVMQWSYYEAALMASAALPNIGVVSFSFACLYFATRGGAGGAAACAAFGVLAVGSQANGLFALPLAALACGLAGRRSRAAVLTLVAIALWSGYFIGYSRPAGHPSVLSALSHPLEAIQLFLVIVGGIFPGRWAPILVGVAILALLGWLARRGVWREHPTAALWIAFVLLSAAAATAGRAGFGVFHASRYAVYSTCLVAIAFLGVCVATRPWNRATVVLAVIGTVVASFSVSLASWPEVREYSAKARLLTKVLVSSDAQLEGYHGMLFPNAEWSARALRAAERNRLYTPREVVLHAPTLRAVRTLPPATRLAGYLDEVRIEGSRATLTGWTDIPASHAGRTVSVFAFAGEPTGLTLQIKLRPDVAMSMQDPGLLFSGFRMQVEYPSEAQAREASASLCVLVEAPGERAAVLGRSPVNCPPRPR